MCDNAGAKLADAQFLGPEISLVSFGCFFKQKNTLDALEVLSGPFLGVLPRRFSVTVRITFVILRRNLGRHLLHSDHNEAFNKLKYMKEKNLCLNDKFQWFCRV